MPVPFIHPSTIIVAGPTRSGKTVFVRRLILEKMIVPYPSRIVIIYDEPQNEYAKIAAAPARVEFHKGPLTSDIYESFLPRERNLVVIDDQLADSARSHIVEKLFTQGAHHRNLTVILVVQNLFEKGKTMRTTNLNSNYLVLYKNPRDKTQAGIIGRQMYPQKWRQFVPAFETATTAPYTYLVIDLMPDIPEELRLRSNIFPSDSNPGTDIFLL